jgi:energy-coupling factor transport system permease protein
MIRLLEKLMIGRWTAGNSFLHRLDPSFKVLYTAICVLFILTSETLFILLFDIILLILLFCTVRISICRILYGIKGIVLFAFIAGFLTGGFFHAMILSIKLLLLLSMITFLTVTTTPAALAEGLERLLQPFSRFGIKSERIAMMISIAFRFLPLFIDEFEQTVKSLKARGVEMGNGSLFSRFKGMTYIWLPLCFGMLRRAEETATALEIRCFRGYGRTRRRKVPYGKNEAVTSAFMFVLTAIHAGIGFWS